MYLRIKEFCYFFEKLSEADSNYFNTEDYQICSGEERQELIDEETYEAGDFLLIPQLERDEIVKKFLARNNEQSLLRKTGDEALFPGFHRYLEDNHLTDEWNQFEKSELIAFASDWCERNQIEFTVK